MLYHRNNISPAHEEVRDISHAPSQTRVASASLFVVRSTLTICSLYSSTAVRIRVGFSFQVRLPGLYDITPSPIVSRVRTIAPIISCILECVWYEIVAYITARTPLATSMSLKPADLSSTKARIFVPFPTLPVLPCEQVICSKLPHYVSIYFFAFSAFAYEHAIGCSK